MMPEYAKIFLIIIFLSSVIFDGALAEEALTWRDCIREAARNNPSVIAAVEAVKQSAASKDITASALYPQIDSNLGASTSRTDNGAVKSIGDSYSYGLSGSQLIFDGTKTISKVRAAGEAVTAAQESFRFTSATVRYKLRTAFVNLLKAQEMLRITREIYEIRRQNLELITLRYESGLEHRGALLTAEADVAAAVYGASQAERNLEVTQRELIKEMGRPHLAPIEAKGNFEVRDEEKNKPDFEALAEKNPSLQQAVAKKNSAAFSLKAAYANFSPALTGTAGANKNGGHWAPAGNQWNLGLALTMPIFEGGLRIAQVSEARAILNQLQEDERSARNGIIYTLEQSWAALADAIQNVYVQKDALDAAEERSKIAQAQYSIGFISFDNWIIIEDNLVKAKRSFLDARASALYAQANWIQAKGETLEYE